MDSGRVYRVGRDQTNDIVIEHGSVSRHHCELRLQDDGAILVVDLNSMNGTAVRQNGAWEHIEQATVERDERILLGEVVTTVAALLMRAPKTAARPPAPEPAPAPRKIPLPTAPAAPEASGLVRRMINSDWARLHRRSRERKAPRDEPSICLPAFVGAAEAEGDPARLLRAAPSLVPGAGADDAVSRRGPSLAENAAPAVPAEGAAAPRRAPSLLFKPALEARPPASRAGRRFPPAWLRRANSPRFAKWAVAGSVLLLMSGGAVAAYLRYAPGAEPRVAAVPAAPAARAEPERAPDADKVAVRPSDDKKPGLAKPAAPEPPARSGRPWQVSIDGTPDSEIAAAAPSGDGLCLAGTASLSGGREAWVLRTDGDGTVRWQRRPGGPGRDGALAVTASGDGGCTVAGFDSDEKRLWIFKLDAKGVLTWSRTVPVGHSGRAVAIVRARDGGYGVAAHARLGADKPDRAFVLRLSPGGEIKWSKFAGKGESRAADLRETADGGFVVAGTARERGDARLALWAARLDRSGRTVWEQHFAGAGTPDAVRVEVARGRDFVVAATMTGPKPAAGDAPPAAALRLLRIAGDGDVVWDRRHAAPRRVAGLVLIRGGILVAGDAGDAAPELWLAQFDAQGRAARESRLPAAPGDRAAALAELGNGRLALVGTAALGTAARRGAGFIFLDRDRQLAGR
ncbi:MAG: FHA domain-containing protein [Candidatus Odyssella sp.]|nr:FHA domain-containing protein [Candidatus Odyssella sp.]